MTLKEANTMLARHKLKLRVGSLDDVIDADAKREFCHLIHADATTGPVFGISDLTTELIQSLIDDYDD